jgi:RNA polymerase sigma-70 factor, ECF subfamily
VSGSGATSPLDESDVRRAYATGATAWPDVAIAYDTFKDRLTELGVAAADAQLRAADLYLAVGCAQGQPSALAHFEREHIGSVPLYVQRSGLAAELMGELRQRVRLKLLLGAPPAIAKYRGVGALSAWVRVSAVRVAVDLAARADDRHEVASDLLDLCTAAEASPELQTVKTLYQDRFRATVQASFVRLGAREKALLRMHFLEELSLDRLAAIYRVHRSTIARWLVAIRSEVLADVRREFGLSGGASTAELRSLVSVLRREVQVSARRVLASS